VVGVITRERTVSSSEPRRHEARRTSAVLKVHIRRSVAMATWVCEACAVVCRPGVGV